MEGWMAGWLAVLVEEMHMQVEWCVVWSGLEWPGLVSSCDGPLYYYSWMGHRMMIVTGAPAGHEEEDTGRMTLQLSLVVGRSLWMSPWVEEGEPSLDLWT